MKLVLVTGPASEPVSVQEAADHLRVDFGDDDALISARIGAAREWAEDFTRRQFITATYDLYFDSWPAFPIVLPRPPLASVTSITYYDEDDTAAVWAASNYYVDTAAEPGRIVLKTGAVAPSVTLREANAVVVRFVAGYGAAGDVPEKVRAAILLTVGDLYENRENTVIGAGNSLVEVPFGAKALLWPLRVL